MSIFANPDPTFQPAMRIITAITNAFPASVTTSFAHNYSTGTIVRLIVPMGFGMLQANNLTGTITVTSDTTFTIDIDTTSFDTFAVPSENPGHYYTKAQVVPIGEVNEILTAATQNVLTS